MAGPGERKIKWARWAFGAVVALALAVILGLLFAPRPTPVDAEPVRTGPITESVADQGYARVREAYVVSSPVSGRLERVELDVGDRVQAGRTLVARIRPLSAGLLDPRARAQAQAALAAATAAADAADAQLAQLVAETGKADADLARVARLAEQGFASAQALQDAQTAARARHAAVRAASAQLQVRRAETAVARAALLGPEVSGAQAVAVTSPASGYVTRVLQESERSVAMGAPLVEVSDKGGLEAAIEFLSQDAVRIREGMAAEIYDWGGPGVLTAVVRRVEPQGFTKTSALGVEEQRVLVLLQLTGDPAQWAALGPGYRVWGRVVLRREPAAIKAPLGALVRKHGGWAAFRIIEGRARLTPIEVGALSDREAEVRSGLRPGDQVIVFPSDKVNDGARVKARPAAEAGKDAQRAG